MEDNIGRESIDYLLGKKIEHVIYGQGTIVKIVWHTIYVDFITQPALIKFPYESYASGKYFKIVGGKKYGRI